MLPLRFSVNFDDEVVGHGPEEGGVGDQENFGAVAVGQFVGAGAMGGVDFRLGGFWRGFGVNGEVFRLMGENKRGILRNFAFSIGLGSGI